MLDDIDNDWPAPGWWLPVRTVVVTREAPVLVGVDGTRHPARVTAADDRAGVHLIDRVVTTEGCLIALHHECTGHSPRAD